MAQGRNPLRCFLLLTNQVLLESRQHVEGHGRLRILEVTGVLKLMDEATNDLEVGSGRSLLDHLMRFDQRDRRDMQDEFLAAATFEQLSCAHIAREHGSRDRNDPVRLDEDVVLGHQ
jgi:hypothetical protein